MTIETLAALSNVIITQPHCPYCVKAKALLAERKHEMVLKVLGEDLDKATMIEFIEQKANVTVRTVPQIILDGKYIGGHDDLVAYFERQQEADVLMDFDIEL